MAAPVAVPVLENHLGSMRVVVVRANGLRAADINGKSDPFVQVTWVGTEKKKTKKTDVQKKTLNPVWNETFDFEITDRTFANGGKFKFKLFDEDAIGDPEPLGKCHVDVPKDFWSTKEYKLEVHYKGKHKGDLTVIVSRVSHFKVGGPGEVTPWNADQPFEKDGWEMKFSLDADGKVVGRNKNDGSGVSKAYSGTLINGVADITVNFGNGQVSHYKGTILPDRAELRIELVKPASGAPEKAGAYKFARGPVKVNAK